MRRLFSTCLCMCFCVALTGCGTAVPDVKGMAVVQAAQALETAGFKIGQVTYSETATGAIGAVIAQTPAAGQRTEEGSLVVVTVAGPPPVKTPDLKGLDAEKAKTVLEAANLSLGDVGESYDASVSAGLLVSQEPSAGVEVPDGSSIQIVVSKGPKPVAVPNTKGKSEADAVKALEAAGFKVKTEKRSDSSKKGTVIAQKPSSGEAQPGKTVLITVSTGIEMVRVPRVIGMYPSDAASKLRATGLRVKDVDIHGPIDSDSGNAGFGQVYRQTPKSGTTVPKGTTVEIRSWWEAG